jgi:hypothetical protein
VLHPVTLDLGCGSSSHQRSWWWRCKTLYALSAPDLLSAQPLLSFCLFLVARDVLFDQKVPSLILCLSSLWCEISWVFLKDLLTGRASFRFHELAKNNSAFVCVVLGLPLESSLCNKGLNRCELCIVY